MTAEEKATESETTNNLDIFNVAVGIVFDFFLSQFPVGQSIPLERFEKEMEPIIDRAEKNSNEGGRERRAGKKYIKSSNIPPNEYINEVTSWLVREGFLHQIIEKGWGTEYQLTGKALTVLNAMPSGLSQTLGKKLSTAVKDAGTAAGRSVISETVGQIIGAAARSFAGG